MRDKLMGRLDLSLLPKAERKVIQKAASLNPASRYKTCGEMVRALQGREPVWPMVVKTLATLVVLVGCALTAGELLLPDQWKPTEFVARFIARGTPIIPPKAPLQETEKYQAVLAVIKALS